jgi:hypothetical protein
MRADMYKVIVERPRRGGGAAFKGQARLFRNAEDTPSKIGIKKGHKHRKWLNENLSPLKRFLESQVGQSWDKVYSELSSGIDRRNTAQEHIYTHIDQFVAIKTQWQALENKRANNGDCVIVKTSGWRGVWLSLRECYFELYVHPRSGLLLKNPFYERWGAREKRERAEKERSFGLKQYIVSPTLEYRIIDEQWYEIIREQFPKCAANTKALRWDAIEHKVIAGHAPNYFAKRKRQLSKNCIEAIKKAQQFAGPFFTRIILFGTDCDPVDRHATHCC